MKPRQRFSDDEVRRALRQTVGLAALLSVIPIVSWLLGAGSTMLLFVPVGWLLPPGIVVAAKLNQWWYDRGSADES